MTDDTVLVAAIAGATTIIAAMLQRNHRATTDLHILVNSRLSELLATTKTQAHQEGMMDERANAERKADQ